MRSEAARYSIRIELGDTLVVSTAELIAPLVVRYKTANLIESQKWYRSGKYIERKSEPQCFFENILSYYIYVFTVCALAYMCTHMCTCTHAWHGWGSKLSSLLLCGSQESRDGTLIMRLGGKCLYSVNHLDNPNLSFLSYSFNGLTISYKRLLQVSWVMFQQNLTETWILKTDYFFFVLLCYFLKLVACCIAQADLDWTHRLPSSWYPLCPFHIFICLK